jgi:RNA polymerase sigma factor (sigma-70 family)
MVSRCGEFSLETLEALRNRIIKLGGPRDGEDVFQDVCLKLLSGPKAKRSLAGLAMCIARSKLCDTRRQRALHPQCLFDHVREPSGWEGNPELELECRESAELLDRALAKLSPGNRVAFLAKYDQQQRDQQAANDLGITRETFRTRHTRARKQLQRLLCPAELLPLHQDFATLLSARSD